MTAPEQETDGATMLGWQKRMQDGAKDDRVRRAIEAKFEEFRQMSIRRIKAVCRTVARGYEIRKVK